MTLQDHAKDFLRKRKLKYQNVIPDEQILKWLQEFNKERTIETINELHTIKDIMEYGGCVIGLGSITNLIKKLQEETK